MIGRYVSPLEARRLVSALLAVLGFIALVAFFAFLVVPGQRYRVDAASEASGQVPGEAGWLDPTDYPPRAREVVPPLDPATVLAPGPALLDRGRTLYAQLCGSCHGAEGKGDGPASLGLRPPVRDFTKAAGWKNGPTLAAIYRTLEEGLKGSSMASYAHLPRKDRMALVHFVRSLGTFDHGPEDPAALGALSRSFAAAGETLPNRIPVREAMVLLAREYRPPRPLVPGRPIVRRAVADPALAATTLAGIPGWPGDAGTLARGVTATLGANGFSPSVATWSRGRWEDLRRALLLEGTPP